jgi:NADH-quinone oxidoreductase subunit M
MGEFLILLGVFQAKLVIAIIALTGVALASVYMLRAYIRTMHNRPGDKVVSRDLSGRDALVVAPLVAAILAFAVYPQQALEQGERSAEAAIRAAQEAAGQDGATAERRP